MTTASRKADQSSKTTADAKPTSPAVPVVEKPEPVQLTVAALRELLATAPDTALVRTGAGPAGSVTVDGSGVLIAKLTVRGPASRPNQSVSQADRGVAIAEFAAKLLGRKDSTEFSQMDAADAMGCSPFVISYSVKSEHCLTAFAAKGLALSGPTKKVYVVNRKA